MLLSTKLSHEFATRIQFRGAQYFRDGSVKISDASATHVEALVYGHGRYCVSLRLVDSKLHAACTCPYFEQGEECKHVWATILAADRKNYLSRAAEYERLEFIFGLHASQ